jgi:hypothetical protein
VPISRREISRPCPDVNRLDHALRTFSAKRCAVADATAARSFISAATIEGIEISMSGL